MSMPMKVLWSEGLTLGPQQLQQQDRYHEARLQRVASSINAQLWGVSSLQWRTEELLNNVLRAESMALVFPDGELYDAPASDLLPAPVNLATLPAGESVFTFYAALPMLKPYGGNLAGGARDEGGARYVREERETADLFSEGLSIEVSYLKKELCLLSQLDARDAFLHFPVVRLRRAVGGGFEIDPGFIPPSVTIAGAAGLTALLENLLSKLHTKIESLYSRHRQPNKDIVEFHSGDMSSFWMLHAISGACGALADCASCSEQHPRRLFEVMLDLAAGLLAFSTKYALAELPRYQHGDPARHFLKLDLMIRDLVDTVIATKYFSIALVKDETGAPRYRGALDAGKVGQDSALCLAVNADLPALELVAMVPRLLKVGAPDDVERMVAASLFGIELLHLAQVPAAIPVRPNTYYFSIEKKGALYENMLKAQAIAIYAPAGIEGLRLELLAIAS